MSVYTLAHVNALSTLQELVSARDAMLKTLQEAETYMVPSLSLHTHITHTCMTKTHMTYVHHVQTTKKPVEGRGRGGGRGGRGGGGGGRGGGGDGELFSAKQVQEAAKVAAKEAAKEATAIAAKEANAIADKWINKINNVAAPPVAAPPSEDALKRARDEGEQRGAHS